MYSTHQEINTAERCCVNAWFSFEPWELGTTPDLAVGETTRGRSAIITQRIPCFSSPDLALGEEKPGGKDRS
jgi:hypothetical protein